ncbi:para-nitrobenzyl esterase [Granulicella pectinivorans]|uniref:Carboxylic ester hydrolase n=1 Tax=Granulicella pectinivorans TaxID=474950 RepID=A0A1I6MYV0_9BACT|nr:carboxylesterase/lipase family protein [Granulicella pectinivorans]SFS20885.1 para-nitrobenzyl esterase [Granulicella pectinivorans]
MSTSRSLLRLSATVLSLFALASAPLRAADDLTVKVTGGQVAGALTEDGRVEKFLGIPYAAPPVGDLRWKAPQPVVAWEGVKPARDFGNHCMQASAFSDMLFRDPGESEDCLTLNVWAPVKANKLPVMVWIYGGGYQGGSASEGRQDGEALAHRGVIVVSMNYRLGIWGFLVHPELTAESPHRASGNYGLMDQSAALAWVKQNIEAFGGDPGNVTLFGESAGSFSVSTQMASPLSKGLFHKAIGESGGALYASGPQAKTRKEREAIDSAYMLKAFGTTKISELRKLTSEQLKTAIMSKETPGRFGPDVDGYFLPDSVASIYKAGKQAHVPLIAGWNADEGGTKARDMPFEFRAKAEKEFPDKADQFVLLYPSGREVLSRRAANDYAGDKFIAYSTWRWLEAQVKTGGQPVYRYHFELPAPGDKYHKADSGAFHSDEINYVFGTLEHRPEAVWGPEHFVLSEKMGEYWTNFAKTGDPNGPGLPRWPVYGPEDWTVLHLNAIVVAQPDDLRARYLFLDSYWGK